MNKQNTTEADSHIEGLGLGAGWNRWRRLSTNIQNGLKTLIHDTIKLLEENIGKTFSDINHTIVFLGQSPKAIEINTKINKWDLTNLRRFSTAKETINKMKRQPTNSEKISANDVTDKGLTSKMYKELIQLNTKQANGQKVRSSRWTLLSKENIQMADRHMKRCSPLRIIREMQSKTIMKYHFNWSSSKSLQITNAGKGVEKSEPSSLLIWNVNWCTYYG